MTPRLDFFQSSSRRNRIACFAVGLFLLTLITGCAGITKDFRSAVRFGWSPLAGAYYESTKDVNAEAKLTRDPESGEVTGLEAKFSSLASTVNPTIVPIQEGYVAQMQVNANIQMHIADKLTQTADRLAGMLETVLQAVVTKDGVKLGAANGARPMTPVSIP